MYSYVNKVYFAKTNEEKIMDAEKGEKIVRNKMKSLFGIDNIETYDHNLVEGRLCFTMAFFPTRGSGYEEMMECCIDESGEIVWKHSPVR